MWTVCCLSQAFQEDVKRRYSVSSVVKLTEEHLKKLNIFQSLNSERISLHTSKVAEVSQLSVAAYLKWKQRESRIPEKPE